MTYTRDQILAMDAEQLRLAIAEAIEPKPVYVPNIALVLFEPQWSEKGAWFCTSIYSRGDVPMWLPRNYTGDISAAWELVEEMDKKGVWQLSNGDGDSQDFRFMIPWKGENSKHGYVFVSCDSAPLAICKCWLIWKEGV